jgi:lipoprotein-anchoring transpeptidase ErfK/SrfK
MRGNQIWPRGRIPAGERLSIDVVVKRPGIISWLTGSTERVHLDLTAPTATVKTPFLTLRSGQPLHVSFTHPVQVVSYGQPGSLQRHTLSPARDTVELPKSSPAGSLMVAGAPRTWESARAQAVSWFPAGAQQASAVASPAPGSKIGASTPITLTFSKPVDRALGGHLPPVSPNTPGTWRTVNDHTIVFQPDGYGYGLGATVKVPLPSGVQLVGAQQSGGGPVATWTVPQGSTVRLQQMLALLGYLPVTFNYSSGAGVGLTPAAQEQAAVNPPAGTFQWRWANVPGQLRSMWQPGTSGTMTKGALMAFENDQNMTADGVPGPDVWRALMQAVISGKRSTFGYTFVTVSEGSPETQSTWHNGQVVVSGPVNTGIPGAATALGVYPVFEHALSVTMSGTNPDGSHYSDPGVPYVSYFNGGDALHGFLRGSYGSAQSLGCVEMPYDEASHVYRYTPIGTLVNVVS